MVMGTSLSAMTFAMTTALALAAAAAAFAACLFRFLFSLLLFSDQVEEPSQVWQWPPVGLH